MKRCVSITLNIDPTDYNDAEDTKQGCIDLVIACLRGEADFATKATVCCEGEVSKIDLV